MESLGQDKVLEDEDVKEAKEQIKTQKEDAKEVKKEQQESRTPLQKLISYVELGGILLLIGTFRKPLMKLGAKIFKNVENEVIKVDVALKADLKDVEKTLRDAIIKNHMLDPIQCYRIGGELYTQLVQNANWDNYIYLTDDPLPGAISPNFAVGTGEGVFTANQQLARALSVHILGITEYLIANGRDLSAVN